MEKLSSRFFLLPETYDVGGKREERQQIGGQETEDESQGEDEQGLGKAASGITHKRPRPYPSAHNEHVHEVHAERAVAGGDQYFGHGGGQRQAGDGIAGKAKPCKTHHGNKDAQIPEKAVEVNAAGLCLAVSCAA